MLFSPRTCAWCAETFTPHSGRQQRCDPCRSTPPSMAGRCLNCGSPVSGRALWGVSWGGECDRAETRAADMLAKLGTRATT